MVTGDTCDLHYDLIQHKTVRAIVVQPAGKKGPAAFSSIAFHVDGYRFVVTADDDSDEIVCAVEPATLPAGTDSALHPVLQEMIGRDFGWLWYAKNSQGYEDALMLAFGDGSIGGMISPRYVLMVEASTIHVSRIIPCEA